MRIDNPMYMEGWIDLAHDVRSFLHKSIEAHNGVKSSQDALTVLNDLIEFEHRINLIIFEYRRYLESDQNDELGERLLYLAIDNTKEG